MASSSSIEIELADGNPLAGERCSVCGGLMAGRAESTGEPDRSSRLIQHMGAMLMIDR